MSDQLSRAGWIVEVECPTTGPAKYLAGFDTPREAMLAVRDRYGRRTLRFKGCVRMTSVALRESRLLKSEIRSLQ
jgi:hypothetical protein